MCEEPSDRSFMMDPWSYFSFQPVLHDWCNNGRVMCYPACGMVHIKEPLLFEKSSPCSGGHAFPLTASVVLYCISDVTKCVECVVK